MPVHDVFKARQGGVCVGGKLEGGALKPGSKLLLVPGYEAAVVKSLEVNGQVSRERRLTACSASKLDAAQMVFKAVVCDSKGRIDNDGSDTSCCGLASAVWGVCCSSCVQLHVCWHLGSRPNRCWQEIEFVIYQHTVLTPGVEQMISVYHINQYCVS